MNLLIEIISQFINRSDFFLQALVKHIQISVIAIVLVTVAGLTLGIMMTRYPKIASPILSFLNFMWTIPVIAFFGILISILGLSTFNLVFVLLIYGLFPMVKNTYLGIEGVDQSMVELAKGMGSSGRQLLFQVELPLALPLIIVGFRNMVIMMISFVTIASFMGIVGGLGKVIWRGISLNNLSMTIAGSLIVALLAIVIDLILGYIEKRAIYRSQGIPRGGIVDE